MNKALLRNLTFEEMRHFLLTSTNGNPALEAICSHIEDIEHELDIQFEKQLDSRYWEGFKDGLEEGIKKVV